MQVGNRLRAVTTTGIGGQAQQGAQGGAAAAAPAAARDMANAADGRVALQEMRFEQARQAAAQRAAKSVAEVDSVARLSQAAGMRQIGARQFVQQNGVWTDQRYTQSQRMVRVKPYSPLYFELIAKLAGLSEALVLGEQVIVAGKSIAIQIDAAGSERMSERELADVVRGWN